MDDVLIIDQPVIGDWSVTNGWMMDLNKHVKVKENENKVI